VLVVAEYDASFLGIRNGVELAEFLAEILSSGQARCMQLTAPVRQHVAETLQALRHRAKWQADTTI
jgi:hypothetical protein